MKMLDFNAITQPTWSVKLKDTDKTVVTLTAPTVELIDRLAAVAPELKKISQEKDTKAVQALYDFVAELMNCNEDGLKFTGETLRDAYKMGLIDMIVFIPAYIDFVNEIKSAKN